MWNYPHSVEVYIKANESQMREGIKNQKKKKKKESKDPSGMNDPFSENKNNQSKQHESCRAPSHKAFAPQIK